MKLFTIGFTKKSAEEFFTKLKRPDLRRLLDVRLNNISQLAGFTKRDDLAYFCGAILGIDYQHVPDLAPTQAMLDEYKKSSPRVWSAYEVAFLNLLEKRDVKDTLNRALLNGACLLCSEPTPEHCHRRLVAEYLSQKWSGIEIEHIL